MVAAAQKLHLPEDIFVKARRRAITDPVWFAQEILQLKQLPGERSLKQDPQSSWELDQWTVDLLDAVGDVVRKMKGVPTKINHKGINQISVRSMHGPGKTFGLAVLMHWFSFCFKGKIPCTAPKLDQLKTRLWPEFKKIRGRAITGYSRLMRAQGQAIHWMDVDGKFEDGQAAFMETAAAPENLAGLHDRYMMICVDEASGVDEGLWPVIEGAISTGKIVILVIISNPTRATGTFADSHLKPIVSKDWFKMHIRLEDTHRVKRDWVQRMINKYGKKSPVVKIRCYGDFADDDENQLFSMAWLELARATPFEPDGSLPRRRLSIDVADGGQNFSVITLGTHYQSFLYLVRQKEYSFPGGRSVTMCCNELDRWWAKYELNADNGDDIVVDALGVGAGVCSEMVERERPVIRYIGGAASDNTKLYRCRRVQSYMSLRDEWQSESIVLADDFVDDDDEWDDLYGQLCSIRRKIGTERIEDLITKEEMVRLKITSPDRADSIAMQLATQSPILGKIDASSIILGNQMETASNDGSLT